MSNQYDLSTEQGKVHLELCRKIGIQDVNIDYFCDSENTKSVLRESSCIVGDWFSLLDWHDVEEILDKYVEWLLLKNDETKIIEFYFTNPTGDIIQTEGKTSLETGLKAVLKIAEILGKEAKDL
jgi:hypothetical protein